MTSRIIRVIARRRRLRRQAAVLCAANERLASATAILWPECEVPQ